MPVVRVQAIRRDGQLVIRMGRANRYGIGGRVHAITLPEDATPSTEQITGFEDAYEALRILGS